LLRIGRGIWRGQILRPDLKGVRPTPSRVREALMSIIAGRVKGATVWDLFSGSGAFGIECLSCGAAKLFFVDSSSGNLARIESFLKSKEGDFQYSALRGKLPGALSRLVPPADIVFIDPPYDSPFIYSWIKKNQWSDLVSPGGLVIAESGGEMFDENWETRRYGDTRIHILEV